ncbi:MAG: hypothetical protein AAF557_12935 [Pseudomonadota bacterium]
MGILSFSSGKVLVLYTDGVIAHAAVFQRLKGKPEAVARAKSHAGDIEGAASELIDSLRSQISIPKTALLATDRAVFMLSNLPVDPTRPRSYHQMRELARWETEPAFSELPDWSVADVLHGTGRINPAQDETIAAEVIHSQRPGMPQTRYQDIALRMGYIDRASREFAVDTQERLAQQVSTPACGWAGANVGSASSTQFVWRLSATAETEREAWFNALKKKRIKLTGVVPGWGLGLPAKGQEGPLLVLEHHGNAIFARTHGDDGLETVRLMDLSSSTFDEASILDRLLDGTLPESVTGYGFSPEAEDQIADAAPTALFQPDWPTAALRGLATMALATKTTWESAPTIAPREPPRPIHKNPDFYRIALVIGVAAAIAGVELYNRYRLAGLERQLTALEKEYTEKRNISDRIRSMIAQVDFLKAAVVDAETEVKEARKSEETAAYLQDRRTVLPVKLLEAVREAAHPGLVMRSISESDELSEIFIASAWSVSELGAEKFINKLNQNISPLGLSVADESVFRERGLRSLDGYSVKLRIAKSPRNQLTEARQ